MARPTARGARSSSWPPPTAAQRGIRFRRNFGKAAALQAGFQAARGERVVTLDADLQDDPREIPRLLALLEGQPRLDLVSGWKRVRHDPWHKVGPSRVFNYLVSRLTGVWLHDHNCGMKCYRREVLAELRLYGELHRFIPVLAAARGFRVGELAIAHRPRRFGHSKYGWIRFVRGFLDLLTVKFLVGFGNRPQHLLGGAGLVFFAIGFVGLIYLAGYWVVRQARPELNLPPLHERPAMLYAWGCGRGPILFDWAAGRARRGPARPRRRCIFYRRVRRRSRSEREPTP